jgi:PHD/YefM family antitoxin component YafN of YafNO toxin-antitoxin module
VQLKETRSPLVLTVNGVAELVVQSAESYQILVDRLEYLETVAVEPQDSESLARA